MSLGNIPSSFFYWSSDMGSNQVMKVAMGLEVGTVSQEQGCLPLDRI